MFVTNWISTTKIQKISEITNFFRHYFLSRTEVENHYKDQKFRPWVILRYTFRKNAEKKHKLGKVLNSTEEGISILKK